MHAIRRQPGMQPVVAVVATVAERLTEAERSVLRATGLTGWLDPAAYSDAVLSSKRQAEFRSAVDHLISTGLLERPAGCTRLVRLGRLGLQVQARVTDCLARAR
jgi:hypothetical protein